MQLYTEALQRTEVIIGVAMPCVMQGDQNLFLFDKFDPSRTFASSYRASAYRVFITIQIVAFIATFINVEMIICHVSESPWTSEHKRFYKL